MDNERKQALYFNSARVNGFKINIVTSITWLVTMRKK